SMRLCPPPTSSSCWSTTLSSLVSIVPCWRRRSFMTLVEFGTDHQQKSHLNSSTCLIQAIGWKSHRTANAVLLQMLYVLIQVVDPQCKSESRLIHLGHFRCSDQLQIVGDDGRIEIPVPMIR